ncbi:MAG: FAD-dependent oxidoreductase [Burkholderiales bacterium]
MASKRLLLLGGGHAHVQVVHAFATRPPATRVTLMDRAPLAAYSGMLPGLIAGHYSVADSHIDLAALCAWAGIAFVQEEAVSLDLERRAVTTADGGRHEFDLLSIDTGSTPPLDAIRGAREHAIAVKPIDAFLDAIDRRIAQFAQQPGQALAVIGAGAAGFEVVLALEHRLRMRAGGNHAATLRLIAESDTVLPDFPQRVRRHAERRLREQGIVVHAGCAVRTVEREGVVLVTGAAPAPMFRRSGLATDEHGFIAVDATLRSLSHLDVFACGDVAAVLPHPRPKSGVYAVRQGPPLTANLLRALEAKPLWPFVPQREALALLSTGRKHAIANRDGFTVQGDWVWRWKDRIDRRFVQRFGVRDERPART